MKTYAIAAGVALALATLSAPALADELLVTGAADKSGSSISLALDLVSDGKTRGFDFVIPVTTKGAKVDTTQCFANLHKSFQGACKFNGTEITGIAFAWDNVTLPAGVHSLGTITIKGGMLEKKGSGYAVQFNSADAGGASIQSTVRADLAVESPRAFDSLNAEK